MSMYLLAFNWSSFLSNLGQFILSFSILVTLHELGHFVAARYFGCRVEKFYLFFNPWFSLWKKKVGETEYGLGWVPFGGYVKIAGMIDESMDKEQMNQPPQAYEFRSKPAWQRLIIMLAGVIVNFILALVIFAMILFVWGEDKMPVQNLKYGFAVDSVSRSVGMRDGDMIKAVNGKPLTYVDDLPKEVILSSKVTFDVSRNGLDTSITMPAGYISGMTKGQRKNFLSPRIPVIVDSVPSDVKFIKGSFAKGDRIVGINGNRVEYYNEYQDLKKKFKGQNVDLQIIHPTGDTAIVSVKVNDDGIIGFLPKNPYLLLGSEHKSYGFFEAIPAGIKHGVDRLGEYIQGIKLLFTSKEHKVNDNLGSVISIGKTFGGYWDWERFWTMTALFSIILAFMNILPIPALDGGHALFCIIEMVTGKKPSDKFMEYAQSFGMILMLGLMVYALGLDIFRLFK